MAKRIFQAPNWTPGTVADASALANATYMALKGGNSTQIVRLLDIYISGMAATGSPMALALARSSTIGVTPTALANPNTDAGANPNTTALSSGPVVTYVAAGTGPLRSNAVTDARMNLGINAFGGSYRWNAAPGQEWVLIGNAASAGETILSNLPFGTPGALNCSIMYEPE